ncbi:MAG TPA: dipeptide epimerase [Gemmatimonadaceae bacterium]|nr:dipeptide epimerase [Gemmatimonadaceae bacterium]
MRLEVSVERWPIAGRFTIARGSRTEAVVVVATIRAGEHVGRGECVPYARYGETVEGVAAEIETQWQLVEHGLDRAALQAQVPAGAARNALDCALWDLEAKRSGRRAWEAAGVPQPRPVTTAYTLSLATPDEMRVAAEAAKSRPLLKVKLGGVGDAARIRAVRAGAPRSRLIVDANESWRRETIGENLAACEEAGVVLIEQPFPADDDAALDHVRSSIPICADESFHDRQSFDAIAERYQAINIKLDKTGGLTEALQVARMARARGLQMMVGCMLGTSLAMAPAMMLAGEADFVDLDGPLLLATDREPGLRFEGSVVHPPEATLWG